MTESRKSSVQRAVAFIDGQNLYRAVKTAFGYDLPNYDVRKLSQAICDSRGWWLVGVNFYTGIPSVDDDREKFQFWMEKKRRMENSGVNVVMRNLVPGKLNPDGSWRGQKEKGIDARLSIDAVKFFSSNTFVDVVLIFSQDQDLGEAANEIVEIAQKSGRKVEVASVFPINKEYNFGIRGTLQISFDQDLYDCCRDDILDINPILMSRELSNLRTALSQEQLRRSAIENSLGTEREINLRLMNEAEKLNSKLKEAERLQNKLVYKENETKTKLESQLQREQEQQKQLLGKLTTAEEVNFKLQDQINELTNQVIETQKLIKSQLLKLNDVIGSLSNLTDATLEKMPATNEVEKGASEKLTHKTREQKHTEATEVNNLGVNCYKDGKLIESETAFRKAIELRPDFQVAYRNLGNTLVNLGRLQDAESAFRRAIELNPKDASSFNYLGNVLFSLGYYAKAETAFRRAIKLKPDFAQAYNNLGNAALKQLRYSKAKSSFSKAIELKPDYSSAINNLKDVLNQEMEMLKNKLKS